METLNITKADCTVGPPDVNPKLATYIGAILGLYYKEWPLFVLSSGVCETEAEARKDFDTHAHEYIGDGKYKFSLGGIKVFNGPHGATWRDQIYSI